MPLKIVLLVSSFWGIGIGLALWLTIKAFRSWWYGLGLLVLGIVTYSLCYVYVPCFDLAGSVACHGDRQQKWLALTFDDGPQEPYTSQILDILKREHVPATFFVLGKYVPKSPTVIQRMVSEGHVVGNHGMSHATLAFQGDNFMRLEVEGWEEATAFVGIKDPKIFRASHGWKNPVLVSMLRTKGYQLIGWDVGVWDSDKPGAEVLLERLKKGIKPGSIVLLHDGDGDHDGGDRSQTVSLLPELIHYYKSLGFRFVTVPEILAK